MISGRWVLGAGRSPSEVLSNHSVLVVGDRIAKVGPTKELVAAHPQLTIIGGDDTAILPGLINAHHHAFGIPLIRQGIADDRLEPWMISVGAAAPSETCVASAYSAAKMMSSGVTTVVDMCGVPSWKLSEHIAAKAAAYRKLGLRVAIAPGWREKNLLAQADGEDQAFIDQLPEDLRSLAEMILAKNGKSDLCQVSAISSLFAAYENDPLVDVWFGPPGPQWIGSKTADALTYAASNGARVQTHLMESFAEGIEGLRSHGKTAVGWLKERGLLGPWLSVAHGVWLGDDDLANLADSHTVLVHNPSSNLRLGSGIAPIARASELGVPLALGMDGTTMADDEDMFAEMRLALRLSHAPEPGQPWLTPSDVFAMATLGGARVMGRENELGRIAPGFLADICVLDIGRFTKPWISNRANPLDVIVQSAKADDVSMVLIAGKICHQRDQLTSESASRVLAKAAADAAANEDSSQHEAVQRLAVHVAEWHAAWPRNFMLPRTIYNARRIGSSSDG